MEENITQFVHSEGGFITAIVLIILGLSDLVSAYYVTNYRPDLLPLPADKVKSLMTIIYFVSSLLVLIGFYMLYIRV